jgi:hypothetical protein
MKNARHASYEHLASVDLGKGVDSIRDLSFFYTIAEMNPLTQRN